MKKCFVYLFILAQAMTQAQVNLVPNPSFEEKIACSDNGQIENASEWVTIRNTPNYFNSCETFDFSVPSNSFGFQHPTSDGCHAYAGFYSYTAPFQSAREYFGVQLDSMLKIGSKYFVSFKTVRASGQLRASNNIGVLFTTQQFLQAPSDPLKNFSHINYTNVITDTLNWTIVFGSFIADSSYTFMEVGNFYEDSNTIVTSENALAYYFVDDICVSSDSLFCATYEYTCTVGIKESYKEGFPLYPNPTDGMLFFKASSQLLIKLYNLQGENLFVIAKPANSNSIDLSSLSNGMYFIQVFSDNQIAHSKIEIIH